MQICIFKSGISCTLYVVVFLYWFVYFHVSLSPARVIAWHVYCQCLFRFSNCLACGFGGWNAYVFSFFRICVYVFLVSLSNYMSLFVSIAYVIGVDSVRFVSYCFALFLQFSCLIVFGRLLVWSVRGVWCVWAWIRVIFMRDHIVIYLWWSCVHFIVYRQKIT